jgi:acyl carrier protein
MLYNRERILADVLQELNQLADDWEYEGQITPETSFFTDLGMESLDVVVLATAAQERYGQAFPFTEYFAELGQQEDRDITVGMWTDFIASHLGAAPPVTIAKDQDAWTSARY